MRHLAPHCSFFRDCRHYNFWPKLVPGVIWHFVHRHRFKPTHVVTARCRWFSALRWFHGSLAFDQIWKVELSGNSSKSVADLSAWQRSGTQARDAVTVKQPLFSSLELLTPPHPPVDRSIRKPDPCNDESTSPNRNRSKVDSVIDDVADPMTRAALNYSRTLNGAGSGIRAS